MSYAFTIDETTNLLVVKFWGEILYSEEAEAVLTILEDPRIAPGVRILVDRTDSSFGASPEDVRPHVELVGQKLATLGEPQVAVAVSADLDFGMLRMFEAVSDGRLEHKFRVFRGLEDACHWLEAPQNQIQWPKK